MNILLISNSAPKYYNFFNALAKLFMQDGENIVAAVDSSYSSLENKLGDVGFSSVYEFSDFFKDHQADREILSRYSEYDLNGALLSDFERSQVYGIWGNAANIDFFDRLKSGLLSYFEHIFDRHSIDVVLYENVSNTFSHYALFVAQKMGAFYCGLTGSRLPGRFSITADPLHDDKTERAFQAIQDGQLIIEPAVHDWVRDYIGRIESISPDYMKVNGLDRIGLFGRYFQRERLRKIATLLRHTPDSRTNAFQIGNPLRTHLNLFLRNARRRLRAGQVSRLYQPPLQGERFLLYPLHFHPESSTSILAGTYLNEYEVIRNIAFSLPEGVRLYVKDHISAWAYPSSDFYRQLKRLPNVRLLGPHEPTKQLIKASEAVITLTSTVGYEALLLHKQVFLYGRVFYEFHKGVTRITDPSSLRPLLAQRLRNPQSWDYNYNHNFVCAYHHNTLSGSLNLIQDAQEACAHANELYPRIKFMIETSNKKRVVTS